MSIRSAVRTLRAYEAGRPLPNGETLRMPIGEDEDVMVLAFLRMGGESRPWAIGWQWLDTEPTVLSVPDGRNRDDVGPIVAEFAPALLEHLRHPDFEEGEFEEDAAAPLRQVWVPNETHLTMLHYLAFTYNRVTADEKRVPAAQRAWLETLARCAGWSFAESRRPGNISIVNTTSALQDAFTFPADDLRSQHLGFLLGWLGEGSPDELAEAAAVAERSSVSTSLDPTVENEQLEELVERRTELRGKRGAKAVEKEISAVLQAEVTGRLELVCGAIDVLRSDGRRLNAGLSELKDLADDEHENRFVYSERPKADGTARFRPSPETDHFPAAAAANYFNQEYCADVQVNALVHDDDELQREAIAAGDGIRGTITTVEEFTPPGARKPRARWTIEAHHPGPLRLQAGSEICVAGVRERTGEITELDRDDVDVRLTVEITKSPEARPPEGGFKGLLAAYDHSLVGREVTLLPVIHTFFAQRKRGLIWRRDGPGGWLTHRNGEMPSSGRRRRGAPKDPIAAIEKLRAKP